MGLIVGDTRLRPAVRKFDPSRAAYIARARELLGVPSTSKPAETSEATACDEPHMLPRPCRCCGGRMIIIDTFAAGCQPKHRPAPETAARSIDTS